MNLQKTAITLLALLIFLSLSTAEAFSFTGFLKKGSQSAEVRLLQKVLNTLGYSVATGTDETGSPKPGSLGAETDYYGSLTASALKSLQCVFSDINPSGYCHWPSANKR